MKAAHGIGRAAFEMQRAALAYPLASARDTRNDLHFRRFDLEHAVGLTANK